MERGLTASATALADAAADLDVAGAEQDGGGRDLLQDEAADRVALLEQADLVAVFEADAGGAAVGLGMPGGADDADVGEAGALDGLDGLRG